MSGRYQLLIASNNPHKIEEVQHILDELLHGAVQILSPASLDLHVEVEETGMTLEENAYLKAIAFHRASGLPAIADDTGLEVEALNGAPGIHTARYAGEDQDDRKNRQKLLKELSAVAPEKRNARFRTMICFVDSLRIFFAEGICPGKIAEQERGTGGFGYDPIFIPEGYHRTFAELPAAIKNRISHRRRALEAFAQKFAAYYDIPLATQHR